MGETDGGGAATPSAVPRRGVLGIGAVVATGVLGTALAGCSRAQAALAVPRVTGDSLNAKELGATGDGVHDDAPALQAAIDKAAEERMVLVLPAGSYLLGSTLNLHSQVALQGVGMKSSILQTTASAPVLRLNGVGHCRLEEFGIQPGSGVPGMVAIDASLANNVLVQAIDVHGPGSGIVLDKSDLFFVHHCNFSGLTGAAVSIQGGSHDSFFDRLIVYNEQLPRAQRGIGFELINGSAISISNCDIMGCAHGLIAAPGSGEGVEWIRCESSYFDNAVSEGVLLSTAGGGVAQSMSFVGCWISSSHTASGVGLDGVSGAEFAFCEIYNNAHAGVSVMRYSPGCRFFGGNIVSNNASQGSYANVEISAAYGGTGGVWFDGVDLRVKGYMFSAGAVRSVHVAAGTSSDYRITNCMVDGAAPAIEDGGLGSGRRILGNAGFNPRGWAVATPSLPAGTGSGYAVQNTHAYPVSVYQTGGRGMHVVDPLGTDYALPATPAVWTLDPDARVYYTAAVPADWRWYGH